MEVLVLGGTGSMGKPLIDHLGNTEAVQVTVTSRKKRISKYLNVDYIEGNAHDKEFLKRVLDKKFNVIIDFMNYRVDEFKNNIDMLLEKTEQYIFISSCRVYADSENLIDEKSSRLLDSSNDDTFLSSNEYSLSKAKQENILLKSQFKNWTIVRPYITYGNERLQLGIYEKEDWLFRAINKKTIIFPRDMSECLTTMTSGKDVSKRLGKLIGNKEALGEIVNIVNSESITWKDVLNIYSNEFRKVMGYDLKIKWVDKSTDISKVMHAEYQAKYDRLYNRKFSDMKLRIIIKDKSKYVSTIDGLSDDLKSFLNGKRNFKTFPWKLFSYMDVISSEKTTLKSFTSINQKIKYLICRYTPYFRIILNKVGDNE